MKSSSKVSSTHKSLNKSSGESKKRQFFIIFGDTDNKIKIEIDQTQNNEVIKTFISRFLNIDTKKFYISNLEDQKTNFSCYKDKFQFKIAFNTTTAKISFNIQKEKKIIIKDSDKMENSKLIKEFEKFGFYYSDICASNNLNFCIFGFPLRKEHLLFNFLPEEVEVSVTLDENAITIKYAPYYFSFGVNELLSEASKFVGQKLSRSNKSSFDIKPRNVNNKKVRFIKGEEYYIISAYSFEFISFHNDKIKKTYLLDYSVRISEAKEQIAEYISNNQYHIEPSDIIIYNDNKDEVAGNKLLNTIERRFIDIRAKQVTSELPKKIKKKMKHKLKAPDDSKPTSTPPPKQNITPIIMNFKEKDQSFSKPSNNMPSLENKNKTKQPNATSFNKNSNPKPVTKANQQQPRQGNQKLSPTKQPTLRSSYKPYPTKTPSNSSNKHNYVDQSKNKPPPGKGTSKTKPEDKNHDRFTRSAVIKKERTITQSDNKTAGGIKEEEINHKSESNRPKLSVKHFMPKVTATETEFKASKETEEEPRKEEMKKKEEEDTIEVVFIFEDEMSKENKPFRERVRVDKTIGELIEEIRQRFGIEMNLELKYKENIEEMKYPKVNIDVEMNLSEIEEDWYLEEIKGKKERTLYISPAPKKEQKNKDKDKVKNENKDKVKIEDKDKNENEGKDKVKIEDKNKVKIEDKNKVKIEDKDKNENEGKDEDEDMNKSKRKSKGLKAFMPKITSLDQKQTTSDVDKHYVFSYNEEEKDLILPKDSLLKSHLKLLREVFNIETKEKLILKDSKDGNDEPEEEIKNTNVKMETFDGHTINIYLEGTSMSDFGSTMARMSKPGAIIRTYNFQTNRSDETKQIKLDSEATVKSFKRAISREYEVPNLSNIKILFAGKVLLDNIVLEDLEVGDSLLYVYIQSTEDLLLLSCYAVQVPTEYEYEYLYEEEEEDDQ